MGRELRITVTSLALVLASCSGGPVSDLPRAVDSDGQDNAGGEGRAEDGGAASEDPGASNGNTGSDNGAVNGSFDAGAAPVTPDADLDAATDGGVPEAGTDAGALDGGDAADGTTNIVP